MTKICSECKCDLELNEDNFYKRWSNQELSLQNSGNQCKNCVKQRLKDNHFSSKTEEGKIILLTYREFVQENSILFSENKRRCKHCTEIKNLNNDFYTDSTMIGGKRIICKLCDKKQNYLSKYGITFEQLQNILTLQNNKCLICLNEVKMFIFDFTNGDKRESHFGVIDHCHKTKNIRGILCDTCNKGLGFFKDDINLLNSAIKYLNESIIN
jgi:hypothetical protein